MNSDDTTYHCEICKTEISKELADFTWDLCDFHRFCHVHKKAYMDARSQVVIEWDKEKDKFVPRLVVGLK